MFEQLCMNKEKLNTILQKMLFTINKLYVYVIRCNILWYYYL